VSHLASTADSDCWRGLKGICVSVGDSGSLLCIDYDSFEGSEEGGDSLVTQAVALTAKLSDVVIFHMW
jgi:hypothetical protein